MPEDKIFKIKTVKLIPLKVHKICNKYQALYIFLCQFVSGNDFCIFKAACHTKRSHNHMMIVRNKVLYESPAIFQVARSVY